MPSEPGGVLGGRVCGALNTWPRAVPLSVRRALIQGKKSRSKEECRVLSCQTLAKVLGWVWGGLLGCFTEEMHAKQILNKKNDIVSFAFYCVSTLKFLNFFYSN